jgi:hypothetical protein
MNNANAEWSALMSFRYFRTLFAPAFAIVMLFDPGNSFGAESGNTGRHDSAAAK